MPVAYSMNYSMSGQAHIYSMFTITCILLSHVFCLFLPLLSLSGVFGCEHAIVWVHGNLCVKWRAMFIICLRPMRCKQKAVFMQPLPALHRSCKQRVAGLSQFLPKKKRKRSQARKLIFSKHFLVLTDGNRQGMWCICGEVDIYDCSDSNNVVLTFARVDICQCCVATAEWSLFCWLINV